MEILISKANESDITAIHAITIAAFEKYSALLGLHHTVKALSESVDTIKTELYTKNILVAKQGDRVIGSIRYHYPSPDVAYISRFGVDVNIHNSGVGKLLLDAVSTYAEKDGASVIVLHTASKMTSLVRMYYGKGYYIHSTEVTKGYIRALFVKELVEDITSVDLSSAMTL
jgi:predicted N-acetyltransferase YhbS